MKETTKHQARGIQWSLSKHLEDIDFADDVALLSQRHNNMTQKLEGIRETAAMIGLKINIQKTKSLRVNQGNNAILTLEEMKSKTSKSSPILAALFLVRVEQTRTL